MLVLGFGVQKFGIHLQRSVQIKGADVDEILGVDEAVLRVVDGGGVVDGLDLGLDLAEFFF